MEKLRVRERQRQKDRGEAGNPGTEKRTITVDKEETASLTGTGRTNTIPLGFNLCLKALLDV